MGVKRRQKKLLGVPLFGGGWSKGGQNDLRVHYLWVVVSQKEVPMIWGSIIWGWGVKRRSKLFGVPLFEGGGLKGGVNDLGFHYLWVGGS